jgi:hypothetical protein
MQNNDKIIEYGTLDANTDTWLLKRPDRFILVDAPFLVDTSLRHKTVSILGRMGIPDSAPGITKLIADKMVGHEAIAIKAFDLYRSGRGGSAQDHWLRAERELLGA